jgi:hypothetical protein
LIPEQRACVSQHPFKNDLQKYLAGFLCLSTNAVFFVCYFLNSVDSDVGGFAISLLQARFFSNIQTSTLVPYPLVSSTDPAQDPSIIKQK